MKKLIFVILDGAADLPCKLLGGKTPLEVAEKPNIDYLSRMGINGLIKILPIPPESDEALIALLGNDVFKVYTGRGPLEALGSNTDFNEGDLALRCNFGSIDLKGNIVSVRIDDLSKEELKAFEDAINSFVSLEGAEFIFKATSGHRGVLVIKSKQKLSSKISNTHPGYVLDYFDINWSRNNVESVALSHSIPQKPNTSFKEAFALEKTPEAEFSAKLVNSFIIQSKLILERHPINIERVKKGLLPVNLIVTRDGGTKLPNLINFKKQYNYNGLCFAETAAEKGIAILSGMTIFPIASSTDEKYEWNIRLTTILRNMSYYDGFYVHFKDPDFFSHNHKIQDKIKSIEDIDKYFFGPLLKNIDLGNTIIVITSDHCTSSETGAHTEDAVPVCIAGGQIKPDFVLNFNEKDCANGFLKEINAMHLMPYVMKLLKY